MAVSTAATFSPAVTTPLPIHFGSDHVSVHSQTFGKTLGQSTRAVVRYSGSELEEAKKINRFAANTPQHRAAMRDLPPAFTF